MKVSDLEEFIRRMPKDADVMLMVPDSSGKKGHVTTHRLSEMRVSRNEASTLANWTDKIVILEGQ